MGQSEQAMIEAARKRWPEMVEQPNIVRARPGRKALVVPVYDKELKWYDHDDPDWGRDHFKEWLGMAPVFSEERIELEQVGSYRLGYGPRSKVLYVGA